MWREGQKISEKETEKKKKKAAGHRKTNPGEKWLPESNPYFFIYGPRSDIFTTLPPTMKFSCYILPRNA